MAELNLGVMVLVVPSRSLADADAVQSVALMKHGQLIKSLKTTVVPMPLQNLMGARRELTRGEFVFPFSAFRSDGPLTILVAGTSKSWEWTMTQEELARLR